MKYLVVTLLQTAMLPLVVWNLQMASASFTSKDGLLPVNQLLSWTLFGNWLNVIPIFRDLNRTNNSSSSGNFEILAFKHRYWNNGSGSIHFLNTGFWSRIKISVSLTTLDHFELLWFNKKFCVHKTIYVTKKNESFSKKIAVPVPIGSKKFVDDDFLTSMFLDNLIPKKNLLGFGVGPWLMIILVF